MHDGKGGGTRRRLDPEAAPFLMEIVRGGTRNLASKAAYPASLIRSDQSAAALETAVASSEVSVRLAAASGLRNLAEADAARLLEQVSADPDPGVRKVALHSTSGFRSPQLVTRVLRMAEQDPEPFVREQAVTVFRRIG